MGKAWIEGFEEVRTFCRIGKPPVGRVKSPLNDPIDKVNVAECIVIRRVIEAHFFKESSMKVGPGLVEIPKKRDADPILISDCIPLFIAYALNAKVKMHDA